MTDKYSDPDPAEIERLLQVLDGPPQASEMSAWHPDWMEDPEFKREFDAYSKRMARVESFTGWLRRVPYIGSVAFTFWYGLFTEGIRATLKPRWGSLTFCFLNDGMKPTLWHTWRQMTHGNEDKFTGIYVDGAPRSYAHALEKEAEYERRRREDPCDDCGVIGGHNWEVEH